MLFICFAVIAASCSSSFILKFADQSNNRSLAVCSSFSTGVLSDSFGVTTSFTVSVATVSAAEGGDAVLSFLAARSTIRALRLNGWSFVIALTDSGVSVSVTLRLLSIISGTKGRYSIVYAVYSRDTV